MIRTTHLRLLVNDFPKEFRFFRDVLGFQSTFGGENDAYADFDCNGFTIALFVKKAQADDYEAHGGAKSPAGDNAENAALIFGVADVDDICNVLKSKGVNFLDEPHDRKDWGIRVAHFRDPEGNLIEINRGLKSS